MPEPPVVVVHYVNVHEGSNLTIQVLHSTLVALTNSLKDGQRLPRSLWLQMDNCSRCDFSLLSQHRNMSGTRTYRTVFSFALGFLFANAFERTCCVFLSNHTVPLSCRLGSKFKISTLPNQPSRNEPLPHFLLTPCWEHPMPFRSSFILLHTIIHQGEQEPQLPRLPSSVGPLRRF